MSSIKSMVSWQTMYRSGLTLQQITQVFVLGFESYGLTQEPAVQSQMQITFEQRLSQILNQNKVAKFESPEVELHFRIEQRCSRRLLEQIHSIPDPGGHSETHVGRKRRRFFDLDFRPPDSRSGVRRGGVASSQAALFQGAKQRCRCVREGRAGVAARQLSAELIN